MKPLVSIVIPTYRAVECLELCVRSICEGGNLEEIEVCLYGDGGGDVPEKHLQKCMEFMSQRGVRHNCFYNPQNLGNTPALNRAIDLASGQWIMVCDDDCVFPANWLERIRHELTHKTVLSLLCIEPDVGGHRPASCFIPHNLGLDPEKFDLDALNNLNSKLSIGEIEVGVNYPFLIERDILLSLGKGDERFKGPYHDPDLFLRFRNAKLRLIRSRATALYHFSGMSMRFSENVPAVVTSPDQKPPKRTKSLRWLRLENDARMVFIKKWGAKPKARFGDIPKTSVSIPWEGRSHGLLETLCFIPLLWWEYARYWFRKGYFKFLENR